MEEQFVVVCDNPEDEPSIYGPFMDRDTARAWIHNTEQEAKDYGDTPCPNEHYIVWLNEPSL